MDPSAAAAATGGWGSGLMGWVGSTLKSYSSLLPHQVSDMFNQDRAFVTARLPSTPLSTVEGSDDCMVVPTVTSAGTAAANVIPQPVGLYKVAAVVP